MYELGINPSYFMRVPKNDRKRDIYECIDLVNKAGFKCVDLSAEKLGGADAFELREFLEKRGMRANQTHCPFNRYENDNYESFASRVMKSAENSYNVGAKIFVVHGDEYDFSKEWTTEKAMQFNYDFFAPAVEYCEKHGMKVAFENVFEDMPNKPRLGSKISDLTTLVDKFGSENVGICWDIGHGKVAGGDNHLAILEEAGKRVISTHVHDNCHGKDLHQYPFLGDCDWSETMSTFKKIGYSGEFTFEFVYGNIPDALIEDYIAIFYKTGKYLVEM